MPASHHNDENDTESFREVGQWKKSLMTEFSIQESCIVEWKRVRIPK